LIRSQWRREASLKASLPHEAVVFDSVCGVVAVPTQPAFKQSRHRTNIIILRDNHGSHESFKLKFQHNRLAMTDPLSISASIAGLMTIADIVIRNGYKYIKAVKESDKAVASLINEVNSLSGTLHSLRNIAEGLEGEHAPFISTTQVHHVESCYRTLRNINELLDKFEFSKTKGLVERATQRLKWPLTHSETKTLALEVARHRETLTLALNADEM
jgi:hypothetical protein